MTRKIKQLFLKYIRSNVLWACVVFFVKIIYHVLGLVRIRISKDAWIGQPKIRTKPASQRVDQYNKTHQTQAIYKKIYDKNNIPYRAPISIEKTIHPTLQAFIDEPQFEQFTLLMPHGKLAGTYTSITDDHRIIRDSVAYHGGNIYGNPYTYSLYPHRYDYIPGTLAVVTGNDTDINYNHWMTVVLPKYHLLQKSGNHIDKYIIDNNTKFHKESIAAMGIPEDKIIVPTRKSYIKTDNMLIASTTTLYSNMPVWAIEYVRQTFLPKTIETNKKRRIYISRITSRKVQNENEVLSMLSHYGFESFVLDNMSIHEQAELFSSAEIVVGPHGAGFTNLMFCSPGTKVIELFHEQTVRGHYYSLSIPCGLIYSYLIGSEIEDKSKIRMDNDMYIPLGKLQATLDLMGIV